jgi:photosystem II stability/assembly factor-like uncharacterized protein
MEKRNSNRIYSFIFLSVILLLISAVNPQESGFTETFDDPLETGWELSGKVYAEDGILVIEPGGEAHRDDRISDFSATLRIMVEGSASFQLGFQKRQEHHYQLIVGSEESILIRRENNNQNELISVTSTIPKGEWFELGWSSINGIISVTTNNKETFLIEDPNPLPPGGFNFSMSGNGGVLLDEFVVKFEEKTTDKTSGPIETQVGESTPHHVEEPRNENEPIPAHQAKSWISTGGPIGGLGYDIRYNFNSPNILYVTDARAGFHMSTDDGLTWFPNNLGIEARADFDSIPVFSVTVDPHDPDVLWLGTKDTGGIYKSNDGGYSWTEMSNGVDKNLLPLAFRGFTVDPRSSEIVYAMAEIGSPGWTPDGSTRTGLELDLTMGIVYKTTDGGENWQEIWRGDNLARYCWINPNNPDMLYISTGIFDREAANTDVEAGFPGGVGILKSVDGGETWEIINEKNGLIDLYVSSLYMHPEDPDILLAAAGQNNWSYYDGRAGAGIFLTEDAGTTWIRVIKDESLTGSGFGELFSVVEFCDANPDIAYALSNMAVYRSEDGGHTWQSLTMVEGQWGPPGIIPGFPIDLQCDPRDPMRIFVNNYLGGNFLSEDGGATWSTASEGYSGAQVRSIGIDSDYPALVYAGSRTGVFRNAIGGRGEWTGLAQIMEGERVTFELNEISAIAVDPSNPAHVIVSTSFTSYAITSYDSGNQWSLNHMPSDIDQIGVTAIAFAPSDPSFVYLSITPTICRDRVTHDLGSKLCSIEGTGVYFSNDNGLTWFRTEGAEGLNQGILTLAVNPIDSLTVIASRYPSGILKTVDGGRTWIEYNVDSSPSPVISLAYDPQNPDFVYAGIAEGGVYRSKDGGASWSQTSAGLEPNAYIASIVVDPVNPQNIYAGDKFSGVYFSSDKGATWSQLNEGLTNRSINVLVISDDGSVVYAGVEGAGVYRLGTPDVVTSYFDEKQGLNEDSSEELDEGESEVIADETADLPIIEQQENDNRQIPCFSSFLPLMAVGILFLIRNQNDKWIV